MPPLPWRSSGRKASSAKGSRRCTSQGGKHDAHDNPVPWSDHGGADHANHAEVSVHDALQVTPRGEAARCGWPRESRRACSVSPGDRLEGRRAGFAGGRGEHGGLHPRGRRLVFRARRGPPDMISIAGYRPRCRSGERALGPRRADRDRSAKFAYGYTVGDRTFGQGIVEDAGKMEVPSGVSANNPVELTARPFRRSIRRSGILQKQPHRRIYMPAAYRPGEPARRVDGPSRIRRRLPQGARRDGCRQPDRRQEDAESDLAAARAIPASTMTVRRNSQGVEYDTLS